MCTLITWGSGPPLEYKCIPLCGHPPWSEPSHRLHCHGWGEGTGSVCEKEGRIWIWLFWILNVRKEEMTMVQLPAVRPHSRLGGNCINTQVLVPALTCEHMCTPLFEYLIWVPAKYFFYFWGFFFGFELFLLWFSCFDLAILFSYFFTPFCHF